MSDDVLPGFEAEAAAIEKMKRQAQIAERKRAMIPKMEAPNKAGYRTLVRTHAYTDVSGEHHRAVTAVLSPEEWREITRAVLAERALAPLEEAS